MQDDKTVAKIIARQRLAQLREQLPTNLIGNPIAVAVIAVACWEFVAVESLLLWAVYSQCINAFGVVLVWLTRGANAKRRPRPWLAAFTIYALADGWTWGLASWLFLAPNSPTLALFFGGVMFGVVAAGQAAFLSYLPAVTGFAMMILLPLGLRLATISLPMNTALAVLDVVYLFVVLSVAFRASRNLVDNWMLSIQLERSERALRDSHDQLEKRVAERTEDLRKSEEKYRAVVDVQSELICRFSPDGLLTFVNEAFCRFFHKDRERLYGVCWVDPDQHFLPETECERLTQTLAELSVDFPETSSEVQIAAPGEKPRWLIWSHRALFDEADQILEYQSSAVDISDRRLAEEQIRFLAHHDPLTELPNRTMFRDHVAQATAFAARNSRRVALMTIDLDNFKHVNDALGHIVGDGLLQEIANRFDSSIRGMDVLAHFGGDRRDIVLARLGGDEFAIAFGDLPSIEQAGALAERLVEALSPAFEVEGQAISVTASVGIAIFPDDSEDPDVLRNFSDLALYRAKEQGRNCYAYYSEDLGNQAQRRTELTSALRHALANEEFSLVFQPKVDTETRRIVGAEALLRWRHPKEGLIAPGDFIPLAESAGLIVGIGTWVLKEACAQMRRWSAAGVKVPPMSVNLSAAQLRDPTLPKIVHETMQANGIAPGMLELEITETTLMYEPAVASQTLAVLRDLGITVGIDDFGSGYSSLNYLKTLPVDRLKIDRSFIVNIAENHQDREIVRSVTQLGHGLDLITLAEGVETEAQFSAISEIGVQEVQGFLTGRPIPPDEFRDIYLRHDEPADPSRVLA